MKLVIYDRQWAQYREALAARLGGEWEVLAGSLDLDWLGRELANADALLALRLPGEVLPAASGLKVFLFPGAGVMQTDPEELPHGCVVVNCFEHETAIAEYVFAALLLHTLKLREYAATFQAGRWDGSGRTGGEPHEEVWGQTVGLLGYGHIAQAIAVRARAFGMRVLAVRERVAASLPEGTPQPDWLGPVAELPRLLAESDFVVVACPLTERTRGLLGAAELAQMKASAILINPSRGEIVDETALFAVLSERRIAGAALDAWWQYPATGEETLHGSRLPFHELPQVLATPHFSGWTHAMIARRIVRMAENLSHLARGEPLERVVLSGSWKPLTAG